MRSLTQMSFVACAALVLGIVLSASASVQAATLTVNSVVDITANDGRCTLREAITAANTDTSSGGVAGECVAGSGTDTIIFSIIGTITTITLTNEMPDLTSNLTISNTQVGGVTVSGNNSFRVFRVTGGVTVGINNLTISNGNGGFYGGGIYNDGTLTVTNSTFSNNSAQFGGSGIYSNSTLTVINSTFSGNSAGYVGGGIFNNNTGTLTVTNSTFSSNSAEYGGGIRSNGGTLTVTDSTFSGNSARSGGDGGGIYQYGTLTVTNSIFSSNSAQNGGGIHNNGLLTVINSTFSDNSARSGGGGISNSSSSPLSVTNSTFNGNSADYGGGIRSNGTATLSNTIVALNTAPTGPDLYGNNPFTSAGYNLIGNADGSAGFTNGPNNDQVGSGASPIDPRLGPLQNNGGSTLTQSLLAGSPAIDRGNSVLTTDQRGFTRPVDGDANGTATDDIGAFEFNGTGTTFVVTKIADTNDGVCDADCSLREAVTAANADPSAEKITFSVTGTITLTNVMPDLTTNLTISNTQVGSVTVSGNNSSRVFVVAGRATVGINNLTISNGNATNDYGGGIYSNGTLNITNSTLSNNSAQYGGAIFNNGVLTVTDSTINDNAASSFGGGIFNVNILTVTSSTISNNSAYHGGGINSGGPLSVTNSTFSGNVAIYYGGGIFNVSILTVTNSTFSDNSASFYDGGGIYSRNTLTITNSTVSGNSASNSRGGGIRNDGTLTVTSSTISGNAAANFGGGILNYGTTATLSNTIVALNTGLSSPDLYSYTNPFASGGYNLIGDNTGSPLTTTTGDQVNINPLLGPLRNNGGATLTRALLAGSPAIDRGNTALSADQRGFIRPVDGDGDGTATDDIGAFEFVNAAPQVSTAPNSTTTMEDMSVHITLTGTDANGDNLTFAITGGPTSGTLGTISTPVCTTQGGGSSSCTLAFTYRPNLNFNGTDTFTYRASDGTASSNIATVQINVMAINDAPTFAVSPTSVTVDEDFSTTQTVSVSPTSVPANEAGQTVTYTLSPASVTFVNVSINPVTGLVSITAITNESGTQTLTITANDGQSGYSTATQTFTLTVNPVNDAPIAVNDSYATPTNVALTVAAPGILTNDTDVDSTTRTAVLVTAPANGTLTLNSDGSFTYTPNLNFSGPDSFTYQATDGTAPSTAATVQLTVNSGGALAFSVANYTVNEQDSTAIITVVRGGDTTQSVTVNYATSSTDATADADYTAMSGTLVFAVGVTSQQFTVPVLDDTSSEATETITLTLSVLTTGAILGPQSTATLTITDNDVANTVQFDATSFNVAEGAGNAQITVTRSGDTSAAAAVDYATTPDGQVLRCDVVNGLASERCDYVTTVGILRFAAGQATANITIPIIDDVYAEGGETFQLSLSNAVGVSLGAQATATLTIQDNDETSSTVNPIDDLPTFVRQQYLDFLSREPDPGGFNGWMAKLNQCPPSEHGNRDSAQDCTRIDVSSAFFRSQEFALKGYYVYRFYQASFGERPQYAEFIRDMSRIKGTTDEELAANRAAFPGEWMTRARFQTKYDALTNAAYVDELLRASSMTESLAPRKGQWVSELDAATKTRAQVLNEIVESPEVEQRFYNESFVAMQYFGYLRRDLDQAGYNGWLEQLNRTGNYRAMVWGFLYSPEHKLRFGPVPGF